MTLLLLIPISLALGLLGLCAFLWALRNGQFDDPDGAAWRIIPPCYPPEPKGKIHDKLAPVAQDRNTGGRL